MGESWFVRPDTETLHLSEGHWIRVRKRLNAGEERAALARMYIAGVDGSLKVNPLTTGIAQVTAYLLDWSLTDDEGHPVLIRGVGIDELTAALDNLAPERFTEIKKAIEAHEAAMDAERTRQKKATGGLAEPAAILVSAGP